MTAIKYRLASLLILVGVAAVVLSGCNAENETQHQPINRDIAAWGDSMTLNSGASPRSDWPSLLGRLRGAQAYNGGVNGQTSWEVRDRMLQKDAELQSRVTILWVGFNNMNDPDAIEHDLDAMINSLNHPRFLVLGLINATEANNQASGDWRENSYKRVIAINQRLAARHGIHYVDVRSNIILASNGQHDAVNPEWCLDILHLNDTGNVWMSQFIARELQNRGW